MLNQTSGSADARRLTRLFRTLAPADRATLLAFASFLAQRAAADTGPTMLRTPHELPRPETESVVGAIKRLTKTYDMLDHGHLFNDTSLLMSAHILQGRAATDVIDDLEALFERHYHIYRDAYLAQDAASPA